MTNLTRLSKPGRPERIGKCQLCGGHNRKLGLLVIADFWGWACEQCRRQVGECMQRLYAGTGEQTEPNE